MIEFVKTFQGLNRAGVYDGGGVYVSMYIYIMAKENIDTLSVINAICAPPNQYQINVNAWLSL